MKKTLAATTLAMVAALAGGVAVAQAGAKPGGNGAEMTRAQLVTRLDARFAALDVDRDGYITATDRTAARDARIAERFRRLDADGNGSVTLAEMKAGHDQRGQARAGHRGPGSDRHHAMRGGRGGPGHAGPTRDADADSRISKAEFQAGALARFDRADTDRNGVVTPAERQAARAAMVAKRGR